MKKFLQIGIFVLIAASVSFAQSTAVDKAKDAVDKAADKVKDALNGDEPPEIPKSTVRGRVIYEGTGQPLRRVWIGFVKIRDITSVAEDEKTAPNQWEYLSAESVLTNDFGEFVMGEVGPGVYQPILKLPGILNPTVSDVQNPVFQQFTFDGVTEAQIDIAVKRGGAVSGKVLYQDGSPLIGAAVSLLRIKAKEGSEEPDVEELPNLGSASTDDRGYYRFAGIPEGEYMVMVAQPSVFDGSNSKVSSYSVQRYFGSSELKTYFPSATEPLDASRLHVFVGEEMSDIDIILAPKQLYEVSGLVVGAKNNALVDGIEIVFRKESEGDVTDYQTKQIRTTMTDSEGRWKFKDLLPGKYVAKVSESSYRRYDDEEGLETTLPKRPNFATSEHNFEVLPGENKDVIFRIAVEGGISGTVSVEGNRELPESVTIYADTQKGHASNDSPETTDYDTEESRQKVRTDFRVDDLAEGEYFINVQATDGFFAKSITVRGQDISNKPIKIKAGEDLSGVKVVLSSGSGTVKGKVVDADETAYLYVYMMAADSGTSLFRAYLKAETDYVGENNEYEIQVRPGEYYLFVKNESEELPSKDAPLEEFEQFVQNLLNNAVKVNVTRGGTESIDLKMPE